MNGRPKHIVIDGRIRRESSGRPIDRLVEELQNLDNFNRYTVLVRSDDHWEMHSPNFITLDCPFAQFSFSPLQQIRFARQLYKLKPDLVHFTMTQQPLLYFGNIVTMTHDLTMLRFIRRGTTSIPVYKIKMVLYRFLLWWGHRKSKRIIVPTKTVAKELAKYQPFTESKTVVINEAGDLPLTGPSLRPDGISDYYIMYVGTAFPHKNLKKLIESFDLIHVKHPTLKLVLVGKTEKHYEELKEWAKSHTSFSNIIFTGFVPDASLKWLFKHCKAYVFASLSEGWGLPALEAMGYDAPVASSNASVMPEVLGSAAHYFDANKPLDMAAKILEVVDNEKLRTGLVMEGRRRLKMYSWHKMADETLIVYKLLLTK